MPHMNKKTNSENGILVQTKSRFKINYEWIGKTIQKKINPKNRQNS